MPPSTFDVETIFLSAPNAGKGVEEPFSVPGTLHTFCLILKVFLSNALKLVLILQIRKLRLKLNHLPKDNRLRCHNQDSYPGLKALALRICNYGVSILQYIT